MVLTRLPPTTWLLEAIVKLILVALIATVMAGVYLINRMINNFGTTPKSARNILHNKQLMLDNNKVYIKHITGLIL